MDGIGRAVAVIVTIAALSPSSARAQTCEKADFKAEQCVLRSDGSRCVEKKDFKKDRCVHPTGKVAVEPLAFVGPALPATEADRVTVFYDVDDNGFPARTTRGAACAHFVKDAAREAGEQKAAGAPSMDTLCAAAASHANGAQYPGWSDASLGWARYGAYLNTYRVAGEAGKSWRADVTTVGSRASFQAWRPDGATSHVRAADRAGIAASIDVCCRATGCGDFVVLGTQQWTQYSCAYDNLGVDMAAHTGTFSTAAGIRAIDESASEADWILLDAVPVPPQSATLQEACGIVASVAVPASTTWTTTFFCPEFRLEPALVDAKGVKLTGKTLDAGSWTLELKTSAAGSATLQLKGGKEAGGATVAITIGEGSDAMIDEAALADRRATSPIATVPAADFLSRKPAGGGAAATAKAEEPAPTEGG